MVTKFNKIETLELEEADDDTFYKKLVIPILEKGESVFDDEGHLIITQDEIQAGLDEIAALYDRLVKIEEAVNETLSWADRSIKACEEAYAKCDGLPTKI